MDALDNLPQEVNNFFGNNSQTTSVFNATWTSKKTEWDRKGYEHTVANDNPNNNLQQQSKLIQHYPIGYRCLGFHHR